MSREEAYRRIAYQFAIVFDDYFTGLSTWEECEEELRIRAAEYMDLVQEY